MDNVLSGILPSIAQNKTDSSSGSSSGLNSFLGLLAGNFGLSDTGAGQAAMGALAPQIAQNTGILSATEETPISFQHWGSLGENDPTNFNVSEWFSSLGGA